MTIQRSFELCAIKEGKEIQESNGEIRTHKDFMKRKARGVLKVAGNKVLPAAPNPKGGNLFRIRRSPLTACHSIVLVNASWRIALSNASRVILLNRELQCIGKPASTFDGRIIIYAPFWLIVDTRSHRTGAINWISRGAALMLYTWPNGGGGI